MRLPLTIFGPIGLDGITAEGIRRQLAELPQSERVRVQINSDGGTVSEAVAIYNLLRTWPGGADTEVVGWALSAASLVLMAGKRIFAHDSSLIMVHAPWMSAAGNAADLRQSADALEVVATTMRTAYRRTGQAEAVIAKWLAGDDHWFTAEQARAFGLVDEILPSTYMSAASLKAIACRHPIPTTIRERIDAMTTPSPVNAGAVAQAARTAEFERQREIRASFEAFKDRDGMAALREKCLGEMACTPQAAGQRILAKMAEGVTPVTPRGYIIDSEHDRRGDFRAAAVDALCMRAGIAVPKPHPAARDLLRTSIVSLAESVVSMHGCSTQGLGPAGIIKAAFTTGTSDFPLLLSNTANKALLYGYDAAPQTHAVWTSEREAKDFKTNTLLALGEAPSLELVPELAEYTHGAMTESAETFAIAKYGKVFTLSREAMINDDLQAFTRMPQAFGAAARRLEADKVYGRLTSNPTMSDGVALFHASHGNLAVSGAAPSVTSLGAARAAMRKQKGVGALDYIDPAPRFLIVPVALETLCEQLLASLVDPSKSNDTGNVAWIRGLTLVADPRLDDASATAWYLAADPNQIEGVARVYLTGEPRPALEEDVGFYVDGIAWKARLEFAATVVGWRALYKNPGA